MKKSPNFAALFKSILVLLVLASIPFFQNCARMEGFDSDMSSMAIEDMHAGCPQGRHSDGSCIYLTPEVETRECSIENGSGIQVRVDENDWGDCAVHSCNSGYMKSGSACLFVPTFRECDIPNGRGLQYETPTGGASCKATSCESGYYLENSKCVFSPVTKSCSVTSGTGTQTNSGAGFGKCEVESCQKGYEIKNSACSFIVLKKPCLVANGSGEQINSGAGFGSCQVTACNTGYAKQSNKCNFIRIARSCTIRNGTGLQENIGSGFGSCRVQRCNSGYKILNNGCAFSPVTRTCGISNGKGLQTNAGSGFGICSVQSCSSGYRNSNNRCVFVPQSRTCPISNGIGSQRNTGSGFGSCVVTSCRSGFIIQGNSCMATQRSCPILNGQGQQKYSTALKTWGSCSIKTCNSGFKVSSVAKFCVKSGAPLVKVNLYIGRKSSGVGNSTWTSSFVVDVMDNINRLLRGHAVFQLTKVENIRDTRLYNMLDQDDFGKSLVNRREFTKITAVVSNPHTTDSAGTAIGIRYNYEPFFVIRSRKNNGSSGDAREVAEIFLHELGHNMGMKHDYGGQVHMDNRYIRDPQVYVKYFKGLIGCTSATCQNTYKKFQNSTPGSSFLNF